MPPSVVSQPAHRLRCVEIEDGAIVRRMSGSVRALLLTLVVWPVGLEAQTPAGVVPRPPERVDIGARYLFYFHGRIVEDQGPDAVSPDYGRYEYRAIVERLAGKGFTVISEARPRDTDPETYAAGVVSQIQHLLTSRVPPASITVIGASKGSVIAMLVSTRLEAPVRYVLMANCNDYVVKTFSPRLHGDVLSIYEESDDLGRTCAPLFARSPALGERREVRLTTGLRHGFIFRPLDAWLEPAVAWARR